MSLTTPFVVLIERLALPAQSAWKHARVALLVSLAALVGATSLQASAAPGGHRKFNKVARDLDEALDDSRSVRRKWARDVGGVRQVQLIVVTNTTDPEMRDLRQHVRRLGGSVHAVHPAVHALTVQIGARQVKALSQRDDVVSVSPNREIQRTASTLEAITGSLTSNVRTSSTKTSYSGLDGTGVGIAVLDSGVMRSHEAMFNGSGVSRVKRNVNMLNANLANWTTGTNATSLMPGSTALASYEAAINADGSTNQDPYGHGTHVAAVAAGRAKYFSAGTPDTTGIAPGADIYDVRVLNENGYGTVSDALEGIQWVIFHAKAYNIRVLNLSLAADSTESWQTDPLCVAVRSATAAGITVVV